MNMVKYYVKRSIGSPVFAGCVVLLTLIMVIGCYPSDLAFARTHPMSVLYCFLVTSSVGVAHVVVPLITVIPFLFHHVEELHKGAVYFRLIRGNRKSEFAGKITAALLSALSVSFLSLLLFTGICLLLGAGGEAGPALPSWFAGRFFGEKVKTDTWSVYAVHGLAFLLYSLPWVLIGLVASLFLKNWYMVFALPFVAEIVMCYITERPGLYWLHPGTGLLKGRVQALYGGGIFYSALYYGGVCVGLIMLYGFLWMRRWRNEGI